MAVSFAEWNELGRAHLVGGRAIDALSCFRKAARLQPRAYPPLSGIAEALWRLGRPHDAIAAWLEAADRLPSHLPTWQSIMQAAMFVGDDTLAARAAAHVREVSPRDSLAQFIEALALLADPAQRPATGEKLRALLQRMPVMLRTAYMGRALARALGGCALDDCPQLREMLARHVDEIALDLVAHAAAGLSIAQIAARIDAEIGDDDLEGLRKLALRLAAIKADPSTLAGHASQPAEASVDRERLAHARAALSQHAADRYCGACAARFRSEIPLLWPLRTAGMRVRVIVLVDTEAIEIDDREWLALAAALKESEVRLDLAFAAFGDAQRVVDRLPSTGLAGARVTQMPLHPDIESARALAAADPDLLLDLTHFKRPIGRLFAARPARRIASVAQSPHPAAPLIDVLLPAKRDEWAGAIDALLVQAPSRTALTAGDMQSRLAQAIQAHRGQQPAQARSIYDAMLLEQPAHAPTLYLRGALRRDSGDAEGAAQDFAAAVDVAPHDARSRVALAQLMLAGHRAAEARDLLQQGLVLDPNDVPTLRAIGHAALAQRDGGSAVEAFAAALAHEPLDGETHYNHGVAMQMLRYVGDAARSYQRSLDLAPDLVDAHFNLGVVFDELGETDSAVTALEYVLRRQPVRAEAHRTLLDVLSRAGRGAQWMRAFERFASACPDALGLVANALEYYQYMGDFAKVHRYIDRLSRDEFKPASELDLVDSLEQLLYLMLFFDVSADTQASLYATYDRAAKRVYGEALPRHASRAPGPLRIGYVSADLREHVMGRMMLDPIRHHDRSRFAIHLYSTSAIDDDVTAQYRALGDAFESLAGLSDAEAVRRIAVADLDILVDLSTHTRGARPAIFARKPARVQITHVGSAGALGLSAVDFKLTDRFADLPANGKFLVERLLPMEGCVYPFRRMTPALEHPFHRGALGIADDTIVLGAFVTPLKLSRRTMALWREILERVPNARLAFSPNAAWLGDAYPAILATANIDPSRAIILPHGRDEAENLARYALVDLVLDPMPFGNVNGTLEPINMRVPVVTLCGQAHGERSGFTLLSALGETRTIASSGKEYVEIAVRLANDPAFNRDVRESIAACLARSAWTDAAVYTRHLEAAYEAALAAPPATAPAMDAADADAS
ncbi:MAG: tetratricopeptide repeat protein [Casimicrobiaceae bacterium]